MGLGEAEINLGAADLVVGTSAGAVFGVPLRAGVPSADPYVRQLSNWIESLS